MVISNDLFLSGVNKIGEFLTELFESMSTTVGTNNSINGVMKKKDYPRFVFFPSFENNLKLLIIISKS